MSGYLLEQETSTTDDFVAMVSADIKGSLDSEGRAFLRRSENLQRFRDELISIMLQIDSQLAAKKAQYLEELAKYNLDTITLKDWVNFKATAARSRSASIRFKQSAMERLIEVKHLIRETSQESKVRTLRNAIYQHAAHQCEADCTDETCVADEKLWSILKG